MPLSGRSQKCDPPVVCVPLGMEAVVAVPGKRAEVRFIHPDEADATTAAAEEEDADAAAEEEEDQASPSQPTSPETASMPGERRERREVSVDPGPEGVEMDHRGPWSRAATGLPSEVK